MEKNAAAVVRPAAATAGPVRRYDSRTAVSGSVQCAPSSSYSGDRMDSVGDPDPDQRGNEGRGDQVQVAQFQAYGAQ